jgi:Mn-dependent DtxR family transcriptional regulator
VVASLQSVGVILVVAMLIIPAATALLLSNRLKVVLLLSALTGMASASLGLVAAILLETTPGPAMTLVATLFYLLAMAFSPQKGLVVRWFRQQKRRRLQQQEDLLKALVKEQEAGHRATEEVAAALGLSPSSLLSHLRPLQRRHWLERADRFEVQLSAEGLRRGYQLIRAHRMWESYLVQSMGLQASQIHQQAEQYEHHLPEGFLQELSEELGHPITDPHGSPIPQAGQQAIALSSLAVGERVMILTEQHLPEVIGQLWKLGINPNQVLELVPALENHIGVQLGEKRVELPQSLANKTFVRRLSHDGRSTPIA